ncbi:helix-turn-helix transcriptional regulator [Azospirillum doebereinerae]|nr:helix-turn-helix transcriptional regulator [Azospirillum doebereinerae]
MTQEELADRIGLSVQSVSAIENARNLPGLDTMVVLADVLGLDLVETLGKPNRPQHRMGAELKVQSLIQRLDDDSLGLAVRQLEILVEHSERLTQKRKSRPA